MRQFSNAAQHIFRLAISIFALTTFGVNAQQLSENTSADALNSIESITTSRSANGQIVLKVGMKAPLSALPEVFTIGTPPRIALTFPRTVNGLGKKTQEFSEGALRSATIVQAADPLQKFRTRLVLNLGQSLTYDPPVIDGNNLIVTLKSIEGTVGAATPNFAEAKSSLQKHSLRDVDFHRGKNGEGLVQVDLSDTNVGIDIKQQGLKLIVEFLKTDLPRNLQRKLDVTDFGTPVQIVDAVAQGGNARLVIEPKSPWEYAAYQADTKFIIEVKRVIAEEVKKKVTSGPKTYDGDKLTLNFQNITVREALNVIADFTNLNIVISDTVSGNLTLRLKDVPWDQAFDIILQSKGLDMRRNGNVVQVAPRQELALKEKGDLTATQEIAELEPMHTESFQLSYAKATDIAKLISDPAQRILSKRGSAVQDVRTNTLFVQDTPAHLEDVRSLIKQIDVAVRQVMIEARFVSAKDTFSRNLGGRLNFTNPADINSFSGTTTGNVNLPGASTGTGGLNLALINTSGTTTLNLELLASQTDGVTKNIASPRVVTADKSSATIESGVEIPYLQASSSGATNVAFKKAVLSLNVTPIITPDDHINMTLAVNQDTVGAIYSGVPSVDTKKVTTQVLVENGGTVIIGGVYTQDDSDSTTKVPLLGDIPVIGWFFKNTTKSRAKNELLIFITPKIMQESLGLK
jgi:type IV pilus assembly protein PilQ